MKRLLGPLLALLASGCVVDNDQSIAIVEQKLPEVASDCMVNTSSDVLTSGILDVGLLEEAGVFGYLLYPLVRNQLTPSAGNVGRLNVSVRGVDIELVPDAFLDPLLPADQRQFFIASCGCTLMPSGSIPLTIEAIPRSLGLALGAGVSGNEVDLPSLTIRARAVASSAGARITSGWVEFPIRLCRYCLSGGPPPSCPAGGYTRGSVRLGACNPPQDLPVTCCRSSTLLCGSEVPAQ